MDETVFSGAGVLENKIKILFGEQCVRLSFFNEHFFIIELESNKVFYNGEEVTVQRGYNGGYQKKENAEIHPKYRLKYVKAKGFMIGLDSGNDGRLFFKVWTADNYRRFRGEPDWIASYWADLIVTKFYINNLHKPFMWHNGVVWQRPISFSKPTKQLRLQDTISQSATKYEPL